MRNSSSLKEVLFVEGIKHNLLIIIQLCDKEFLMKFPKENVLYIFTMNLSYKEYNLITSTR